MAAPKGGSARGGPKNNPNSSRAVAIGVCGALGLLALLAWFVPQRAITVEDTAAAKLDRGPASYFHHFYDPDGLLGPVGKIDLDLDNFQRETSHAILVAAFPSVPANDPDFTMNIARKWRPGTKGVDNGVILFVFTGERRIRAEVGYGLEEALPDVEIKRIIEEAAVPAFRTATRTSRQSRRSQRPSAGITVSDAPLAAGSVTRSAPSSSFAAAPPLAPAGRRGYTRGMRVLIQRVGRASVTVGGERVAQIGHGLLVLVGVTQTDTRATAERLAAKTARLRIFEDDAGLMNLALADVAGEVLAVSQFTLYGDARKGNRPSFTQAARPEQGEAVCEAFVAALRAEGAPVKTGVFGAHMHVELVNDGPVTIMLEA